MHRTSFERVRRALAFLAISTLLFAAAPRVMRAADHGDAPLAGSDQAADIGDVYFSLTRPITRKPL